jgi:3-phenylpropionate/cinnamic acid dioxygenase small subunit
MTLEKLRSFIEDEAEALDSRNYEAWLEMYAEDGMYWAPKYKDQVDGLNTVSLYYDDELARRTRVERLRHTLLHCQDPESACIRTISSSRLVNQDEKQQHFVVRSKLLMVEDRLGHDQRVFAGTVHHTIRVTGDEMKIVLKKVVLTNCDGVFPMLTQPF